MRFLISKDCWANCPLLESHFKGTLLYFDPNIPVLWHEMKCTQVTDSLSELESVGNGQANVFCTRTLGDLDGFGSPAVMSTKGPVQVLQSCRRNRSLYVQWVMLGTASVTWSGNTDRTPVRQWRSWAGVCIQAAPPALPARVVDFTVSLWVISASALISFGIWFKVNHILPDCSFE